MPDPRPCCILGVCCPPGGRDQRNDFVAWLAGKLSSHYGAKDSQELATEWVDELFAKNETSPNA